MAMTFSDQLLDAVGEVGLDLVDMAERVQFPKSFWRRSLPVAACVCLLLGAGLFVKTRISADLPLTQPSQQPETVKAKAVEGETPYYVLELPENPRAVAVVDSAGTVVLKAKDAELIMDQATGEILGLFCTPQNVQDTSDERVICDLEGQERRRICARKVEVLGNVAAVEFNEGNFGLYRLDGTVIRHFLTNAVVLPDCVIGQTDVPSWIVYGADGQVQLTLEDTLLYGHWNGKTSFAKQSEAGLWGVVDAGGNWLLEPAERTIEDIHNGCVFYSQQGASCVLELETGRTISGTAVEPYGDYLLWRSVQDGVAMFRLTDWLGKELISDSQWIQWIDDENDGIPELFLAKQGSAVICVEPDGTERLRIGEAGTIQVVSSQAAVYTKTIQERETGRWVVDFALIDLTTGIGRRSFEKTYTSASVLMTHNASGFAQLQGYFLANYRDLDGNLCGDLLDAAGNIVIENVWNWDSEYRPGDAFCTEGGYRRLDGSWLYRFE